MKGHPLLDVLFLCQSTESKLKSPALKLCLYFGDRKISKRCFSTCVKFEYPRVPTLYNSETHIFFLFGKLSSTDRNSACVEHFISLRWRLSEFLTAIRTPPPFNLNFRGLSGSGG